MGSITKLGLGAVVAFAAWSLVFGPSQIKSDVAYPLTYRVQVVGLADSSERLPLLVVLHGAGADEEDLDGVFANWETPVRVVSFRGPARAGRGYTWSRGEGATRLEARAAQRQMFRDVAGSIAIGAQEVAARYATKGKPMVFGFSRGASMAWYLGAHHPDDFGAVFAVAGALEDHFLDGLQPAIRPPFFAYHGREDGVVAVGGGRATAAAIEGLAGQVLFEEFAGGHTVPDSVGNDVEGQITRLSSG